MQEIDEDMHASKKRRMSERVVVSVKIERNDKRQQRSEGPPSDCWSWRKYGQKPIKGSPYPRGYYKCSTSKGCSAKKQVERSKTDASMLIITYTSTHNHPGPDFSPSTNQNQDQNSKKQDQESSPLIPQETNGQDHSQLSPIFNSIQETPLLIIGNNQEENPFQENLHTLGGVLGEDTKLPFSHDLSSLVKSDEGNDFYDELEELPTSSFFTTFMRSSFCEERSIVNPS